MKNLNKVIILFIGFILSFYSLNAQNKQVREALRNVASGKIVEAETILDDLLNKYPVDPGIIFLQATLTPQADKAISLYRKILNEFTKSEWSDDAYWRLVQYYAIKGDTASAIKALEQFKTFQPLSEYLPAAKDVVYISLMYNKEKGKLPNPKTEIPHKDNIIEKKSQLKAEQANIPKEITPNEATKTNPIIKESSLIEETKVNTNNDKKLRWSLQVGVYSTIENAKAECDKFQKKRLKNQIVEKEINGKKMFAVLIGKYKTKEKAEADKAIVEKICNCETIIYSY